jgi:hypothetical protein
VRPMPTGAGHSLASSRPRFALPPMGRTRLTGFCLHVLSSGDGDKHGLVAATDRVLYEAKRSGKNQIRRGSAQTANVFSGE